MPISTARKYDVIFNVVAAIIAILIGALGASLGMFAGHLIATSIFASPNAPIVGQAIGGIIGLISAAWFIAVAAKEL
jgi:hypothetical protein